MPRDLNLLYLVAYLGHFYEEDLFKSEIFNSDYRRKTETITRSLTVEVTSPLSSCLISRRVCAIRIFTNPSLVYILF
jgi:hypothetical protein